MRRFAVLLSVILSAALLSAQGSQFQAKGDATGESRAARFERQKAERTKHRVARQQAMAKRRAEIQQRREAAQFRRYQLPGEQLDARVKKLTTQLRWHDSLTEAQKVAKQTNKPILWIHALGDIDGYL